MIRATIAIALIALGVAVSGCATAVRGTSQSIPVGSTPEGAECTFTQNGRTVGTVTTPGRITVKREQRSIDVVCTKEGHEEARAVMNSLKDGSPYIYSGLGIISLVTAIGSLTDQASGANNSYQTALMVKLEPLSDADKAARAAARVAASPTTPAGAANTVASVAPSPATSRFDGDYQADIELIQRTSRGDRLNPRHIEVTVRGGVGTGTVKHPACEQPGELQFSIDAAGAVTGTANTVNTDRCQPHTATLAGRVEGRDIRLTITRARHEGTPTDITLTRKTASASAR
jgi:hypothetical protein